MQTQVVILAAGLGTRLGRPHPKPLTPLTNGETIMRRAVHLLRDAWADVHVTAVVGFKLDIVIEAMPDIGFVYNEVYDSTNTSKSLLKALSLSHEGGVLWMNGDVVFDPRVLDIVEERIRNGQSFVCVDHASVADEEVKYTLGEDGMIEELSKTVRRRPRRGGRHQLRLGRRQGRADRAARRVRRPGLLRARHRARDRARTACPSSRSTSRSSRWSRSTSTTTSPAPTRSSPTADEAGCRSASGPSTTPDSRSAPPTRSSSTSCSTAGGSGRSGCSATAGRQRLGPPDRVASVAARSSSTARPGSASSSTSPAGCCTTRRPGSAPATGRIAIVNDEGQPLGIDKSRPDGADLRHPQRGARRPAAGLDRGGAGGPGRGRHRGVPGLRHAARRGPRAAPDRARQRRRPRLRQQRTPPRRRDARVVPAAARGSRSVGYRITRYSGAAFKVDVRRGRRVGARARRVRRLPRRRVPLPDGRDRHAVPARVDLPARHLHARGPHPPGAGRRRPVARGDVRPGLAGARPGLPVRDPAADRAAGSTAGSAAPGSTATTGSAATATAATGCPSRRSVRPRGVRRRAGGRAGDASSTSAAAAASTRSGSRGRVPR